MARPRRRLARAATRCAATACPTDWIAGGAGAEPDCDIRLHQLLAHYAIALCYAQQEDEVLEDVYMKRWQASYRRRPHRDLSAHATTGR